MIELLSRVGAHLGNWNDDFNGRGDRRIECPRRWHIIDRIASLLFVLPDRVKR